MIEDEPPPKIDVARPISETDFNHYVNISFAGWAWENPTIANGGATIPADAAVSFALALLKAASDAAEGEKRALLKMAWAGPPKAPGASA